MRRLIVPVALMLIASATTGALLGPAQSVTSQDQTDERLIALETQVAEQTDDINSLWKHVRALETAVAPATASENDSEPVLADGELSFSGTGQQSTAPTELSGAYNVAATCDDGSFFTIDSVNVTDPDSFEFIDLFGETPFDSSAIATFDGDRYAFTISCDGNWTVTFTPLS